MHQFRIAVATRCFHQPLGQSIKSVAEMNVPGVQFDIRNEVRATELTETGRRDLLHQIGEYGLLVGSTVFPLDHPLYESERIDVRMSAIRDAMKFAYALKTNTLCFRIGRIPEDAASKERKLLVEVLSDLARYGNHVGTVPLISPTNDSAESLKALVQEIKTGPIGIDFDPAHFAMTGRNAAESLRTLHDMVMHVQLRDGTHGIDGGKEEAIGQGNVDWVEVLALLGEIDFRGWLTAIRTQGADRALDLSHGIKLIGRILLGG